MAGLIIDSSVFIAIERHRWSLDRLGDVAADDNAALAAVTAAELLVAIHRAQSPEQRTKREAFVETILSSLPVLAFDLPAARLYARLWAELAMAGRTIGAHDLLIAATALANGMSVLTDNIRDFQRVPGLEVRQPEW